MCWQPKVKVPKMDTNQIRAAEPAPLIEPPKSVVWGGDDENLVCRLLLEKKK